jgi:two-component system LytT family response regulator
METIRTLIVDDEALSRQRLRTLLADEPIVEVVGECADSVAALTAIRELRPALLFLDIQMPGMDGFQVVAQIDPEEGPAVVFATGYDEFAIQAFEANAIDYLLKPVGAARLRATIERVVSRLRAETSLADAQVRHARGAQLHVPGAAYRDRFSVRTGTRHVVLKAVDISWMEAADNYVRLHAAGNTHVLRARMSNLEETLDPRHFRRIHRSAIINVDHVCEIEAWGMGEYLFVLKDGSKVTSSRRYRQTVREVFGV